ncbi:MAG: hypothetical protein HY720_14335 [Planctomycetes bacterium]|nr:hypothetical protein [Planctomycetota bacterium]
MKIIKRYANRKLYDTDEKRYVSLPDIRDLIRKGVDVRVVDNETGDDITSVTLSQIIYEQEKKREGILPPAILKELVQAGGATVVESVKKIARTGQSVARTVEGEVEKIVRRFLKTGEISDSEALELDKELQERGPAEAGASDAERFLEERVHRAVERLRVVSKDDVKKIDALVSELERKVADLVSGKDGRQTP